MTDIPMDSPLSKDQQKTSNIINNNNSNEPTHVVMHGCLFE